MAGNPGAQMHALLRQPHLQEAFEKVKRSHVADGGGPAKPKSELMSLLAKQPAAKTPPARCARPAAAAPRSSRRPRDSPPASWARAP